MSKEFKIPQYTPLQLNSNIAYGLTKENNISKDELDSVQWLCEAYEHQIKQLADLEAKLAERDKTIDETNKEFLSAINDWKQLVEIEKSEKRQIKQQLTQCEADRKYEQEKKDIAMKRVSELKQQLAEKDKILEQHKIDQLYLELLFTRLQWIHKEADKCREEKERFGGIEDMALDSVWRVLDLQKHECCGYEEMAELDDGIGYIAEDKLLITIEQDLNFKATRTENEIIDEIKQLTHQHEYKGE